MPTTKGFFEVVSAMKVSDGGAVYFLPAPMNLDFVACFFSGLSLSALVENASPSFGDFIEATLLKLLM